MNGPLWTLSYEFWLYFIAAIIFLGFHQNQKNLLLLIPFIASIVFFNNDKFIFLAAVWFIGFALYFYGGLFKNKLVTLTLLALPLIIKFTQNGLGFLIPNNDYVYYFYQADLVICLYLSCGYIYRLAVIQRIGEYFSKFAYTLYLMHFPLLLLTFSLFHQEMYQWSYHNMAAFSILIMILIVMMSKFIAVFAENKLFWKGVITYFLTLTIKRIR